MKLLNNGLTQRVRIDDIEVKSSRLRRVSEEKVTAMMSVIEHFGFIGAIELRRDRSQLVLVDGAHRLEAARRMGMEDIPAVLFEGTRLDERAREISANLVGGMTPLQDAMFLAEWKRVYEEMHPETRRGVAGGLTRQGKGPTNLSFAALVAEQRECDVRTVERRIAAVGSLTGSELVEIEQLCPGSAISAIESLGKIGDPVMRSEVVEKIRKGEAKKVSQAIRQVKADRGETPPGSNMKDAAFRALIDAWDRASAADRRRFIDARGLELLPMLGLQLGVEFPPREAAE